ncbi:MAG: GhoT/OrtT family toxin [Bacteroidetes bacterium]|nr:GhoT/OrtT family toxin [Bacteroidota bacterium]
MPSTAAIITSPEDHGRLDWHMPTGSAAPGSGCPNPQTPFPSWKNLQRTRLYANWMMAATWPFSIPMVIRRLHTAFQKME